MRLCIQKNPIWNDTSVVAKYKNNARLRDGVSVALILGRIGKMPQNLYDASLTLIYPRTVNSVIRLPTAPGRVITERAIQQRRNEPYIRSSQRMLANREESRINQMQMQNNLGSSIFSESDTHQVSLIPPPIFGFHSLLRGLT